MLRKIFQEEKISGLDFFLVLDDPISEHPRERRV